MRRLHPRSVVKKSLASGGQLALLAVFFVTTSGDQIGITGPLAALGLAAVGLVVGVAYRVAYYYRFAYELTPEELIVASGVFARQQREIPLDRIQNVDVQRPFLVRLLGLAVVKFETAGGSTTEATLDAVAADEADRLQRQASPEARRERTESVDDTERDPAEQSSRGQQVYEISDGELRLLSLVSFRPGALAVPFVGIPFGGDQVAALIRGVLTTLGVQLSTLAGLDLIVVGGLLAAAVGAYLLVVWAVSAVLTYLQYYGFRLVREGEELRYERGLIGRYSGTIPLDKVQTVTIGENLVARRLGYAKLAVETAGYAPGSDGGGGSETTVPLAARDRVMRLAREVLAASDHTGRFESAFDGLDDASVDADGPPGGETRDSSEQTEPRPVVDPSFAQPEPVARRWYMRRYLAGVGILSAIVGAAAVFADLPIALAAAPLPLALVAPAAARRKWRHRGYHETAWSLLTRQGFWRQRTRVVPSFRLQTVIKTRTPFQRRWGVASVTADTASSASLIGGDAMVHDIDPATATELSDRLLDRLSQSLAERRRHALTHPPGSTDDGSPAGDSTTATQRPDSTPDEEAIGDETAGGEAIGDETADGETTDDETIGDETTGGKPIDDEAAEDGSTVGGSHERSNATERPDPSSDSTE